MISPSISGYRAASRSTISWALGSTDALLRYWESEGHQQPAFLDLSEYLFDDPDADPIKLAHLLIDFFGKNGFEPIPDDDHDITYTCMVLDPKNFKDPDAE